MSAEPNGSNAPHETRHIGIRVDGGAVMGVGHVIRCLALADELTARGMRVTLIGRVEGVAWVDREISNRGLPLVPAPADEPALVDLARQLALDAVILDGYHLPPAGAALRAAGVPVLAVVDAEFGAHQAADLYLDQNLGASPRPRPVPDSVELMGLTHVLFRDQVLAHRDQPRTQNNPPRVLAVFGGTDAFSAGPTMVAALLQTGLPLHVVAIAARPELAAAIEALTPGPGQVVEAIAPVSDLAGVAVTCDLAVTASGTSVWELLCLGVPAALVCVADNQLFGYEACVDRGLAVGLGQLEHIVQDPSTAVAGLRQTLTDPELLSGLRIRGQELVDGRGRERVVDALLARISAPQEQGVQE